MYNLKASLYIVLHYERIILKDLTQDSLDLLSKRELEVLKYIHSHKEQVACMSIQTLANKTHYSTSTILRLTRKLGFSGYSEFKFYLKNQLKTTNAPKGTAEEKLNASFVKNNIKNDIEGSSNIINTDELFHISKLLASGIPIYLHQPGGITNIAVDYLTGLLFAAGCKQVYKSTSSKMTFHLIETAPKPCILILISNSGNHKPTIEIAKRASVEGATIVSISSIEHNELASVSDYNIRFYTKERLNKDADFTPRTCLFFIISSFINYYSSYLKDTENDSRI